MKNSIRVIRTFVKTVDDPSCPLEAGVIHVLPSGQEAVDQDLVKRYKGLKGVGQILTPDEFNELEEKIASLAKKEGHTVDYGKTWMPKEVLLSLYAVPLPSWICPSYGHEPKELPIF
jgi:hypothetical protein